VRREEGEAAVHRLEDGSELRFDVARPMRRLDQMLAARRG
jgi:hypothetical protein